MTDDHLKQLLETAGLPTTSFGQRLADLPVGPRSAHQALFKAFVEIGTISDVSALLARSGLGRHAGALLDELASANLVALDEDGCLRGVFPFSVSPTRHRVEIAGGSVVSAMCAIDALAIPAMIGRGATITSTDPLTDAPITVDISEDGLRWNPASAVVVLGQFGEGALAIACCAHIDFYADQVSAGQALRSVNGVAITIPAALELGNAVFAGLTKAFRNLASHF